MLGGDLEGRQLFDVGVEVVKVPFKVGKGIYDVVKDDETPQPKKD